MFNEYKNVFKIVLQLAKKRREIYEKYPFQGDVSSFLEFEKSPQGKLRFDSDMELENFLNALEYEVIQTIQTIMYIGRDGGSGNCLPSNIYNQKKNSLNWNNKSVEINQILSKIPLDSYLENGFKILGIVI